MCPLSLIVKRVDLFSRGHETERVEALSLMGGRSGMRAGTCVVAMRLSPFAERIRVCAGPK
jgi:hypothetical protein